MPLLQLPPITTIIHYKTNTKNTTRVNTKEVCGNECIFQHPFFWQNWLGVNDEIFMLFLSGIVYWTILFAIEQKAMKENIQSGIKNALKMIRSQVKFSSNSFKLASFKPPRIDDSDVMEERGRTDKIIAARQAHEEAIVISNLTKRYPNGNFLAVDQISFAVAKEQFFGLLGINGNFPLSLPCLNKTVFDLLNCLRNPSTPFTHAD